MNRSLLFLLEMPTSGKAVDIVRGDYVIIGGVDQVNVLQKGTSGTGPAGDP